MRHFKITIAYDGSDLHGWQIQSADKPTIQGEISSVLRRLTQENVMVNGAAVPATTGKVIVLASGRLTVVPAEMPQVVGVPALPVGAEGRFVGQFSVTVPLNVSSGTICN